jgi:hypothetical protein
VEDIEYVRTPDARFEGLRAFPFAPNYARVPLGLRMHFVDEGPPDGDVVVLLHGEPSWSFLYRRSPTNPCGGTTTPTSGTSNGFARCSSITWT